RRAGGSGEPGLLPGPLFTVSVRLLQPPAGQDQNPSLGPQRLLAVLPAAGARTFPVAQGRHTHGGHHPPPAPLAVGRVVPGAAGSPSPGESPGGHITRGPVKRRAI